MERFSLSIKHHGQTRSYHGVFSQYGFSYRFTVDVDGNEVIFEPDEERNLRAIMPVIKKDDANMRELVALIGEELTRQLT